jgi:hypothetical protein
MNFALGLAAGKVRGVKIDSASPTAMAKVAGQSDAQQALARLEDSLLAGDISKQTHDTISKQLDDPKFSQQISQRRLDDPKRAPNIAAITGLILGSPEFQRR